MTSAVHTSENFRDHRLTTVLSADICGYSRMAEEDEALAIRKVNDITALFERVVEAYSGRFFHRAGDGFMAEFPSVTNGLLASRAIIEGVGDLARRRGAGPPISLRIGLHAGDVVQQPDGDLLGHGVNVAARLQQEASPGGVLVSLHAVNLLRDKLPVEFRRRGPLALKNIAEPVIAFDVDFESNLSSLARLVRAVRHTLSTRRFRMAVAALLMVAVTYGIGTHIGGRQALSKDYEAGMALRRLTGNPYTESQARVMRLLLGRLSTAENTAASQVLWLVSSGDFHAAADLLETRIAALPPDTPNQERIEWLRVLGEVLFPIRKEDSVDVFERILDMDPDDDWAKVRLAELYYSQGDWQKSNAGYVEAIEAGRLSDYRLIHAKIAYATSLAIQEDFDRSLQLIDEASAAAERSGLDSLLSRAETRRAYTQVKMGDLAGARGTIEQIIPLQLSLGFFRDLAANYTQLGRIAQTEDRFEEARVQYRQAYELELGQGRTLGIVDLQFHVGMMSLRTGRIDDAETFFSTGLVTARDHDLDHLALKHYIGMASVHDARGDTKAACRSLRRAELLNTERTVYNPWTQGDIRRLPCDYGPIGHVAELMD